MIIGHALASIITARTFLFRADRDIGHCTLFLGAVAVDHIVLTLWACVGHAIFSSLRTITCGTALMYSGTRVAAVVDGPSIAFTTLLTLRHAIVLLSHHTSRPISHTN